MNKQFLSQLDELGCRDKRALVAVSGGLDSVVLFHLILQSGNKVAIAHANFRLRGKESDHDQEFVKKLADDHGVPFYCRQFETNNYATEHGISIQMAARKLRYDWFDELAREDSFDFIITAHHRNDQLETVLLNLVRGTGLAGSLGMQRRNGNILRPLLDFNRKAIEDYAHQEKLSWREDSSNASDDYYRNFIRHHVVPLLRELNPSVEDTFARNELRLHAARELMEYGMSALRQKFVVHGNNKTTILKEFISMFSYQGPVLLEFVKEFGFNLDQCLAMAAAIQTQPGAQFFSPTHQLVVDRDHLIISPLHSTTEDVQIVATMTVIKKGLQTIHVSEVADRTISHDKFVATIDGNKLSFPLIWRKWRPGDSFFPLGMQGRKKISDFLIDNKIPRNDKEEVTILESAGEVVWVVGHRIDERFKVSDSTRQTIRFQVSGPS